jgi:hypothetical protein
VAAIYHDATNSESGFVSLLHNHTPKGQLRLNAQSRHDFFRVPYEPSKNEYEYSSDCYCSSGLRSGQSESDSFAIANWVHTFAEGDAFGQLDHDRRVPITTVRPRF